MPITYALINREMRCGQTLGSKSLHIHIGRDIHILGYGVVTSCMCTWRGECLFQDAFSSLTVYRPMVGAMKWKSFGREQLCQDRLRGLVVRVPGYTTEMYCASCEVRTEFIYVMYKIVDCLCGLVVRVPGYRTEMYCVPCDVRTAFIYVMSFRGVGCILLRYNNK
jgi:hypothetical protein